MSELDFLQFKDQFPGNTVEQKIKQIPPVELLLADNSIYPQKGKVEIVEGQFDKTMGAINFRATFPNVNGLLRSGNTGKIRIPRELVKSVLIPQESTFELQDKVFVYTLLDSNKVEGRPVTVSDRSGRYYLISKGLKPGEKIVYNGLDRLRDGMAIAPQKMSMDSLLLANPISDDRQRRTICHPEHSLSCHPERSRRRYFVRTTRFLRRACALRLRSV
jgi:membrane fusion protein (multidrug efflux system)